MFGSINDLASFLIIKRNLSNNTVRLVTSRYRIFNNWLHLNHLPHNKETTERYLYELKIRGLRNNSINTYIFMFKEIAAYYKDRGIATDDFSSNILNLTKDTQPIEILTLKEIESILSITVPYGKIAKLHLPPEEVTEQLNSLYKTLTRFLATTGCRFSEAMNLRVKYLNLEEKKVTFIETKNKENRHVWITEPLVSELTERIQGKEREEFVFTNLLGNQIVPQNYGLYLSRVKKLLHMTKRLHPHVFRHSFATQLLVSGADISSVATLLGHKDVQTTFKNYIHLADEHLKNQVYRHPLVRKT